MKTLELDGDHFQMGVQHGRQVRDQRPQILGTAFEERLERVNNLPGIALEYANELYQLWEARNQPTLEMMRGIAEALELDWEQYFLYTIEGYLSDRVNYPTLTDGCTTWAANGSFTASKEPLLAKNRDFRPSHEPLQYLARAHPANGIPYLYITSAGSPGVYSSGMNQAGLAVADTYVASFDIGPGLPRYAVMMEMLERYTTVEAGLAYLQSVPHMGNGNMLLLDASGRMATFETGHLEPGVIRNQLGFLVCTNHYVSENLFRYWRDRNPPELVGNSQQRYGRVTRALLDGRGQVDVAWGKALMASHGDPLEALCRHPEIEELSVTISTVFYLPKSRKAVLCSGLPCTAAFEEVEI